MDRTQPAGRGRQTEGGCPLQRAGRRDREGEGERQHEWDEGSVA